MNFFIALKILPKKFKSLTQELSIERFLVFKNPKNILIK